MTSATTRKQTQDYVVPTSNSQDPQPSPLALLAATCSKIGDEGGSQGASPTKGAHHQQQQQSSASAAQESLVAASQLVNFHPQQAIGVLNPDGTITQVSGLGQAAANVHLAGNVAASALKGLTTAAQPGGHQAVAFPQGAQLVANSSGNITYNVIPAQQIQNIQIDGQDAIYIPAMPQTFQIAGNQAILTPTGQTFLRAQGAVPASVQNGSQAVLHNMAQLGGQNVTIRQGNVVQAVQLPMPLQQTIPVQVPVSTAGGQTVMQTIHVPIQTVQGVPGANILQSQGQPITVNVPAHMLPQIASQMGQIAQKPDLPIKLEPLENSYDEEDNENKNLKRTVNQKVTPKKVKSSKKLSSVRLSPEIDSDSGHSNELLDALENHLEQFRVSIITAVKSLK